MFYIAYIDDILVYSNSQEEYTNYIKLVLQKLQEVGLEVDIRKYEFNVIKTKFLGLIILVSGLEIDLEKIKAVKRQEAPINVTKAQSFISFYNFYQRFIQNFSKIIYLIIKLIKKEYYQSFIQNLNIQEAFQEIKGRIILVLVLVYFDYNKTVYLEADLSNYI